MDDTSLVINRVAQLIAELSIELDKLPGLNPGGKWSANYSPDGGTSWNSFEGAINNYYNYSQRPLEQLKRNIDMMVNCLTVRDNDLHNIGYHYPDKSKLDRMIDG
jgi:hypothetical protein